MCYVLGAWLRTTALPLGNLKMTALHHLWTIMQSPNKTGLKTKPYILTNVHTRV